MKKTNRLLQWGLAALATGSLLQAPNCLPNFTQQVIAQISGRSAAIVGNAFELALVELFG